GRVIGVTRPGKKGVGPNAPGGFYPRLEAIGLKRERQPRVFLGEQDSVTTGQVVNVFSTEDLDFPFKPGIRGTIGVQLSDCRSLELSGFIVEDWKESRLFPNQDLATNALFSPYLSIGSFADAFSFSYDSELYNIELNMQRQFGLPYDWSASILTGVRYINLSEHFSLAGA